MGSMSHKYSVVSLFAGCGGKDLGFIRAGFDIVWANDVNQSACNTYSQNIGDHIVCGDITNIKSTLIPEADIIIGGFPCQGFSIVGTRRLDDERNFLYRQMKRIIKDKKPAFFVAENVRGLLNMSGGRVIEAMIKEFREIGYNVQYRLLNARDFGVPQHRERVFIVGNRLGVENPFPRPTHTHVSLKDFHQLSMIDEPTLLPYRTLRDAIGDLGPLGSLPNHEVDEELLARRPEFIKIMKHIKEGQKLCNVRLGPRSVTTWDIPEVYGHVNKEEIHVLVAIAKNRRKKEYGPKDGNPLTIETINTLTSVKNVRKVVDGLVEKEYLIRLGDGYELKNAFNGIFRRLRWDEPSEAILTVFNSPRFYVHPSQDRGFSVRECARIQDFPDNFIFKGSIKEQFTQIGNAVPSSLANAVASSIYKLLVQINYKKTAYTAKIKNAG
jgi:DNA (cytosine-5)-methyltransferase 1